MPSLSISSIALVALLTAAVKAQDPVPNFAATDIPIGTRQQWCTSQISACPLICLQEEAETAATEANTCDSATLTYQCICDNGLQPNASEYSQTLPYFICTENNNICVNNCGNGNSACASSCREDHPCGAQNPTRVNTSTVSTMSATATDGSSSPTGSDTVFTGFGGDSSQPSSTASSGSGSSGSSSSSSSAASIVLNVGELYGLAVVGLGVFTGFTFFL